MRPKNDIRIHNPRTPRIRVHGCGNRGKAGLICKYIVLFRSRHAPRKRATLSLMPTNAVASATLDFPPASSMDILYSADQIAERVREIGAQISADYAAQDAQHPIVL